MTRNKATTLQVLAIQDHAVRTGDRGLLRTAYMALGYDSTVSMMPVSAAEMLRARQVLA